MSAQEQPQAPQPYIKDERDIAEQIGRISNGILERAGKLPEHTLEQPNLDGSVATLDYGEHNGAAYFHGLDYYSDKRSYQEGSPTARATGYRESGAEPDEENVHLSNGSTPADITVETNSPEKGDVQAETREGRPLVNKETITGSAKILGKLRGEVAKREKIAKS